MVQIPPAAPRLFDRALLQQRLARAQRLGPVTFLRDRVAEGMEERLAAVNRSFADVAELWTPGEESLLLSNFSSLIPIKLADSPDEALSLQPQSVDLVVSALALQFVNDLPGVLTQIRRALRPDGLLLAAMIGGDTLTELRQAFAAAEAECEGGVSPRVAPFADLRDIGGLLQRAGFALPVTDVDRVVVRYGNVFALMADLRRMGATNILLERRRMPTRRATMLRLAEIYSERFADPDGRIRATFDVIWLSGWAPHESQPKPLRPGSGTASLEAAVKRRTKTQLPQQIFQMRDRRDIRRRHRVVAQFVGADPGEVLALARHNEAFPTPANVKRHQQMKCLIGMAREGQRCEAWLLDRDADLFAQFTDQGDLRPLAGFDLAAGEFPQPRKRLALGPLRDQHALVGIDQRAGDDEGELQFGHRLAPVSRS